MQHASAEDLQHLQPQYHHPNPETGLCFCPQCRLGMYLSKVYSTQQLASASVMEEMPSPQYTPQPPPPPPANVATPTHCPMWEAFHCCPYGRTCLLPHTTSFSTVSTPTHPNRTRPQAPFVVADAVRDVVRLGLEHENDNYRCYVCSNTDIPADHTMKCGESATYRMCPACMSACYQPQLNNLIDSLLVQVGDDYQKFKDLCDVVRPELPELLKVPFSYEAHRTATTVFAWTLVHPKDAKRALEVADRVAPGYKRLLSVGAGTGYIEHLFSRVVNGRQRADQLAKFDSIDAFDGKAFDRKNDPKPIPRGTTCTGTVADPLELDQICNDIMAKAEPILAAASSFAGVVTEFDLPRMVNVFAFEEIIRPARFSVNVSLGAPNTLMSLGKLQDSVLLLCWPPFGSPTQEQSSMGFETLRHFYNGGGVCVIYVGDVASTGDWRMHEMLATHFEPVKPYMVRREVRRWYPQEMGLVYAGNDTIGVYRRREDPLPRTTWDWRSI